MYALASWRRCMEVSATSEDRALSAVRLSSVPLIRSLPAPCRSIRTASIEPVFEFLAHRCKWTVLEDQAIVEPARIRRIAEFLHSEK